MNKDDNIWRFYRKPGDQRDMPTRRSHAIMTAYHQAGLFRVIQESLHLYCGIRGIVSAKEFMECYRRYLDWKEDLPHVLSNISEGDQPLPHILYLQ